MPAAMRPRSSRPKASAGTAVAARSASTGERPARTRSSSSRWTLAPWAVPGFGASEPASRGTPAACSAPTLSSTLRMALGEGDPPKPLRRPARCDGVRNGATRGSAASSAPPPMSKRLSVTVRVGTMKMPARAASATASPASARSCHTCTSPSAPAAITSSASRAVLTWNTASLSCTRAAATMRGSVDASWVGTGQPAVSPCS